MARPLPPLPPLDSAEAFEAWVQDPAAVATALARLGGEIGVQGPWARPERGSAVVALTAHEVVKLMAPVDLAHHHTERACLAALEGALPVPTPTLVDAGVLDGWPWIRMTRLPGQELVDVWPTLSPSDRLGLATQLGEALAALHAREAPPEVQRVDWPAWCAARLGELEAVQRRRGCPEPLLDGLAAFVQEAEPAQTDPPAWLHTEVMREHLLVAHTPQGWRLTGLFDFEPSWVAPAEYEFAAVGLFVSATDRAVLAEVLRAAGVRTTPHRLFAMAMLHRYANLGWYQRRLGGPDALPDLANAWFGHDDPRPGG